MMTINQFGKLAGVSRKLLRHYEQLGLLVPAHTHPTTGYRYYSAEQLPRLNRVLMLKQLGLSLHDIHKALALSDDDLTALLQQHRTRLQHQWLAAGQRLQTLDAYLDSAKPPVVLKQIAAQPTLGQRRQLASGAEILPFFQDVRAVITDQRLALGTPIGIYHLETLATPSTPSDMGFELHSGQRIDWQHLPGVAQADMEARFITQLPRPTRAVDPLTYQTLEALPLAASILHQGALAERGDKYRLLIEWLQAQHWVATGAIREVYWQIGPDLDSPTNVLEIQIPIQQRNRHL